VVRQYEEAKAWYTRQLGFVVVRDQAFGSGQRFLLVAPPGTPGVGFVLEKARRDDPAMPMDYSDRVGKEVNIVLATSDLTRLAQVLQRRGVRFRQPPRQQPWGGEAVIEDLYGNTFVLVGPIRSGSATSDSVATAGK
jgi:catechol 2,3-dioxygenase-like lactoylglutathione lyase family enzyme